MIGLVRSEEITVPKVGKKEFSYTSKGMAMAKKEAKKTGKSMKMGKKKK
jgi:hypothetical protein